MGQIDGERLTGSYWSWAVSRCIKVCTDQAGPTADVLAPLLYNPSFSNTLLLIGTVEPSPSIEALNSPSHLLHAAPNRTIYPTIQPFNLSDQPIPAHPLPVLIEVATTMATQYRKTAVHTPRPAQRRNSEDSAASSTPPRTPPMSGQFSPDAIDAEIRRASANSSFEQERTSSMAESARPVLSKSSTDFIRPRPKSRITSLNLSRDRVFGSMHTRSKSDTKVNLGGSPIDAVINFIPSPNNFAPERAMQEMLHQSVVLTTGVMPILARRGNKGNSPDPLPVSVLHIMPSQVPGPLPGVIENFILGLMPKFISEGDREIWSSVTTIPAWSASPRQVDNESYTGCEILLFGGLRCPLPQHSDVKQRAFLPNWKVCTVAPGAIAANRPRRPAPVSLRSDPPSIGYANVDARGLPNQANKPLPAIYPDNPRVILRGEMPTSLGGMEPSTPDLDPSYSSCSSSSHVGELGSTVGSDEGHAKVTENGKKKNGLARWFKKSRG